MSNSKLRQEPIPVKSEPMPFLARVTGIGELTREIREVNKLGQRIAPVTNVGDVFNRYVKAIHFSSTSIVLMQSVTSLVACAYDLPMPMKVILALTSIYQLIAVTIRNFLFLFGKITDPVLQKFANMLSEQPQLESQAIELLGGLAIATLVRTILPTAVMDTLNAFSRMSRIKLFDDFSWLGNIATVLLHVPRYAMQTLGEYLAKHGMTHSNEAILKLSDALLNGAKRYYKWLDCVPMVKINHVCDEADRVLEKSKAAAYMQSKEGFAEIRDTRDLLRDTIRNMRDVQTIVSARLTDRMKLVSDLYNRAYESSHPTRPIPVGIVFSGKSNIGKTHFVEGVLELLSSDPVNTVYLHTPAMESNGKTHCDSYAGQTIWYHSELGLAGAHQLMPYVAFIDSPSVKVPVANADLKDSVWFTSSVILATSNLDFISKRFPPDKEFKVADMNAVFRRWLVCAPTQDQIVDGRMTHFTLYRYDCVDSFEYLPERVFSVDEPGVFIEYVHSQVQEAESKFKRQKARFTDVKFKIPALVYGMQEQAGVFRKDLPTEGSSVTSTLVTTVESTVPVAGPLEVEFDDEGITVMDVSEDEPKIIRTTGNPDELALFYGTQDYVVHEVGDGLIISKTKEYWEKFQESAFGSFLATCLDSLMDVVTTLKDALIGLWETDKTLIIGAAGILAAMIVLVAGGSIYAMRNKEDVIKHAIGFQWKAQPRKLRAKQLFAQGNEASAEIPAHVEAVAKNVLMLHIHTGNRRLTAHGLMGNSQCLITNAHSVVDENGECPERVFIKALKGRQVVFENYMTIATIDYGEDYAFLSFEAIVTDKFRKLHIWDISKSTSMDLYLVAHDQVRPIGRADATAVVGVYFSFKVGSTSLPPDAIQYDEQYPGLCGAPIVTGSGQIVGWHVAAYTSDKRRGYARPWRPRVRQLATQLEDRESIRLAREELQGALAIRPNGYAHVAMNSALYETKMLAELPPEHYTEAPRKPANLTLSNFAEAKKKNFQPRDYELNLEAAAFARRSVARMLEKAGNYSKLSKLEMVQGEEDVNQLNKDASAGIPYHGLVSDYVNFETGEIDSRVIEAMDYIMDCFDQGIRDVYAVIFKDQVKDEMRGANKVDKPRVFAAGPLHFTLLIRKYFARAATNMMQVRHQTGIMIGINATSTEWDRLYKQLLKRPFVFDGDYPYWDGGMLKLAQEDVNHVLVQYMEDPSDRAFGKYLLDFLAETTRTSFHEAYVTSHSVPSGHGITAYYNSLVNKYYLAYAWYVLVGQFEKSAGEALQILYEADVYAPVFGDDVLATVAERVHQRFHAISFREVMATLGLGFVTASKELHTTPFSTLSQVTFLKRSFRFHERVGSVTGPLDMNVIESMCGYYRLTEKTRSELQVIDQKMCAVQRELYYHPYAIYLQKWAVFKDAYSRAYETEYLELSERDLHTLHNGLEAQAYSSTAKRDRHLLNQRDRS